MNKIDVHVQTREFKPHLLSIFKTWIEIKLATHMPLAVQHNPLNQCWFNVGPES